MRENEIWERIIALNDASKLAHQLACKPMALIRLGAALNFILLICATLAPEGELSYAWTWILLAVCILPIAIGMSWLSVVARTKIGKLESTFSP